MATVLAQLRYELATRCLNPDPVKALSSERAGSSCGRRPELSFVGHRLLDGMGVKPRALFPTRRQGRGCQKSMFVRPLTPSPLIPHSLHPLPYNQVGPGGKQALWQVGRAWAGLEGNRGHLESLEMDS